MSVLQDGLSLLGKRKEDAHKGNFGRLMCICGSARYRGAARLASESGLRIGAGIVTLASTERVIASVAPALPECTFLPVRETEEGSIAKENISLLLREISAYTACLVGCGMTNCSDTAQIITALLSHAGIPLLLDADALNAICRMPDLLQTADRTPVITPHTGEMARLCHCSVADIEKDRDGIALFFAQKYRCITVLKGHHTCVASPDGQLYVNKTGNPGLARGGSGDLLSGMIGGLLARGMEPYMASVCGVYLHGRSADLCADRLSQNGMLPHDILRDLCTIFSELEQGRHIQ